MRNYYFVIAIFYSFCLNAQIINIPDSNFKNKLLSANVDNNIASQNVNINGTPSFFNKIDTNNDGEIEVSEAILIKFLNLNSTNIIDLTGIEYFSNLESLYCVNNSLFLLNLENFPNLFYLSCDNNSLSSLDLTSNINLKYLSCSNNNLSLLNVNHLLQLKELNCKNCGLSSLNLIGMNNLAKLDCSENLINNLNLNNLQNLLNLKCNDNQMSSLSLDSLSQLLSLECGNNQLLSLDCSSLISLYTLVCHSNNLVNLDLSSSVFLNELICYDNNLNFIFVKNNNADYLDINFFGNENLIYICSDEEDISNIQLYLDYYNYSNCVVNSYCTFTPGGIFYEISGNVKLDTNNNGCDVLDISYPNLNFSITDSTNTGYLIANQTGNYYTPVQAGNYTITPNIENPSYFNISPINFIVNFPTQPSPFNQDFCVTANGVHHDVEIILLPLRPARPGFDTWYKLVYRNKGNQVENGTISLNFDDTRLDYVVANPVYDSSATNSFTWNYSNLQPFETREIILTFNVNSPMETPAVNNGDVLNYTTSITTTNTDETPIDNTFILDQIVVGSYDPNDKTCLEGTTITPSEVGKYVHYVIRFENTGTFPAENIVVKDMIDLAKFDIATLVPLKSSHDFYTRIDGNKVEFIFENINLDFNDATNDGYVVFKIKTLPSLVLGDTFSNNANIYFDYNFPITTNTYSTTITALSSQDFDFGNYFTLYPNPTKDVLNIQSKQNVAINSVEIYNQLGQIVMATTNTINSIDVANLASGTYFVKVNTEKGSANAKFVKE